MNPILDQWRSGLTITTIAAVHPQGTDGNWATVGQRRRGGRHVWRQREKRKSKRPGLRVRTLNVGTMTGESKGLDDMMQRWILCVIRKPGGNKVRSLEQGSSCFSMLWADREIVKELS